MGSPSGLGFAPGVGSAARHSAPEADRALHAATSLDAAPAGRVVASPVLTNALFHAFQSRTRLGGPRRTPLQGEGSHEEG